MAWSSKQIQLAAIACRRAGIDEAQRKLLLRQFERARYDAQGRPSSGGEPSSRSAKLTNADFDAFMAMVEQVGNGNNGTFDAHWQGRDPLARTRHLAQRIVNTLEVEGLLEPEGAGVAGWIKSEITRDHRRCSLDRLTSRELYDLIEGLKAYGRRNGLRWNDDPNATPTGKDSRSARTATPA